MNSYYFFIIFVILYFFMKKKYKYGLFYICGLLFNFLLNFFIKLFVLLPKPYLDTYVFHMKIIQENYSMFELGMPSLFSTLLFYSFGYFYFLFPRSWILNFFGCYLFFTLYLFYMRKQFTLLQMIVGIVIGFVTSYFTYYFCKKEIKGEINENKKHELIISPQI